MLTIERLKEVLHYDPVTGVFTFLINHGKIRKAGEIADSIDADGYGRVSIDSQYYKLHRLAWLYMTGKWPADTIDHRDRRRNRNTFENLREATRSQNCHNMGKHLRNTSGYKGVFWFKGRWRALIGVNRKRIFLGDFDTPEAAHQAYVKAAQEHHGEFARAA